MRKIPPTLIVATILGLIVVTASLSGWAQDAAGPTNMASTPEQAQQTPAGKFIQNLGNSAIGIITDKSLTPPQRAGKYHALLRDAFDLKTIGHFVIGHSWETATSDQQQQYMKLFEDLVVKIYGSRLNFYSGESFHVTGVRQESEKDVIVSSEIDHPGDARPTLVDWRVRQRSGGTLTVLDVVIAGISQSVTQRQEFSSIIQQDGGKMDGLLTVMRERIEGAPADDTW